MNTEKTKTMSKMKHSGNKFTNEQTLRRRAWIEKALDGVRGRFDNGEDDFVLAPEENTRPHLFVVKTDDVR